MATLLREEEMRYLVERFDEIDSNHGNFTSYKIHFKKRFIII